MSELLPPAVRRALAARRAAARQEDGFILLESIVALTLISIILAALGTFAVNSITQTNYLRSRQAATQVATTAMTTMDSLPTDDLITGRDDSSANAGTDSQWKRGDAIADVHSIFTLTNQEKSDGAVAGAGSKAPVSTATQKVTLNSVVYSFDTYVGSCIIPTGTSECVKSGAEGIKQDRVVIWVTWRGQGCSSTAGCVYVTSSLINPTADPVFNTNKSTPPATPIVVKPDDQTSTVGGSVTLNMAVKSGTGVNPFTWSATGLPLGLTINGDTGTITGIPASTQTAAPVTVTVTDAFTRTGSTTFNWTVVAAPTITTPAAQSSQVGTAATLTPTFTCPNAPCGFTAANLPAGLSINATTGVVTGTPTTAGVSAVTITVTDNARVSATTNSFTWTVTAATPKPSVASPGTRGVTIGQDVSFAVAYTCPTPSCTIRLTGTIPNGIGLSTAATNPGNNTATQLTSLTSTSGTVYLTGTVQSGAVPTGSGSKAYGPILTITDSKSQSVTPASGTWTAYEAPTISALAAKTVRTLETSSVGLTYTCPISSCTFALAGTVPGLGLATSAQTTGNSATSLTVTNTSGTIYYTGKVDSSAPSSGYSGTYNPRISVADSNAVGPSTTATYTVNKAPAITNPGTQTVVNGQAFLLQMQATCPNTGCTTWAAAAQYVGDTTWYSLTIDNTGKISQSSYQAPNGDYTVRVTVTDSAGKSDTVYFTLHVVSAMSMNVPDQTTTKPATGSTVVTLDASRLVSPTANGYTYSLTNAPNWLVIDQTTGLITATVTNSSASSGTIAVKAQSNASPGSSASDTFTWTLN